LTTVEIHAGVQVIVGNTSKWIFASFSYLMVLLALGVLLNCLLRAPAFRVPLLLLSLGRIVPAVGFLVVTRRSIPVSPIQATVLFLGLTMLLYLVALYSFRMLQVIPVARDTVIAHLPYGLVVLDSENRLVDFNAAAQALPGLPGKLSLRQPAPRALGGWWDRLAPLTGPNPVTQDVTISARTEPRIFHVNSLPLLQVNGRRIGQAFLFDDVTHERQVEQQQEQAQRALDMLHEREQLARELHDSIGQVLGYAGFQLEAIQGRIQNGQTALAAQQPAGGEMAGGEMASAIADLAQADSQLTRLSSILGEAHADVREYILNLRLAPSSERPFFATLQHFLDGFSQNYGIQAELSIGPGVGEGTFDQGAQMQLYRIIQEALSNARKHAGASHVQVTFAAQDGQVRIQIQDNGRGFDQAVAVQEDHFGLRFMRERAEALGGCLAVISQPGVGTRVEVVLCAC
jgi:signal transduction histidine kinase